MRTLGRLGRACYGHGMLGLLPHHAVTLPLPSGEPVPSDGIVPSKNLCHLFKERYRLPHAGSHHLVSKVDQFGWMVNTNLVVPAPMPQIPPLNDTLEALPVQVVSVQLPDQPVPDTS